MSNILGRSPGTKPKRRWWTCPMCEVSLLHRDMVRRRVKVGQFKMMRSICPYCARRLDTKYV